MNDRYVADVGDFSKFALLRGVERAFRQHEVPHRPGVAWYRTVRASGSAGDGRHTAYLDDPRFRDLDPELVTRLAHIASSRREIEALERAALIDPATVFHRTPLDPPAHADGHRRREHRREWLEDAGGALAQATWVFADPDNGLASERMTLADPDARKYAFLEELACLAGPSRSLILYHHLSRRGTCDEQARALRAQFTARFRDHAFVRVLAARRASVRLYVIVAAPQQAAVFESALAELTSPTWAHVFEEAAA